MMNEENFSCSRHIVISSLFLCSLLLCGCQSGIRGDDVSHEISVAEVEAGGGNVDDAIFKLRKLYEKYPKNIEILLQLASVHEGAGRYEAAVQLYKNAIKLEPNSRIAQICLGKIYMKSENDKAVEMFKNLYQRYGENFDILNDYGVSLDEVGRYSEAQAIYRRAMEVDPAQVSAPVNFSLSLALSGKFKMAIDFIEPYAETSEVSSRARQNFAMILVGDGQRQRAMRVLEKIFSEKDAVRELDEMSKFWEHFSGGDKTIYDSMLHG
ncbi:tetratricopeptide repeat protein [Acetobacter nitrogenifigens]|nr:tetratricopeptide repeat protein [Acetobacter nitrogenifigens]